jgi:hypothetical protein
MEDLVKQISEAQAEAQRLKAIADETKKPGDYELYAKQQGVVAALLAKLEAIRAEEQRRREAEQRQAAAERMTELAGTINALSLTLLQLLGELRRVGSSPVAACRVPVRAIPNDEILYRGLLVEPDGEGGFKVYFTSEDTLKRKVG